MKYLKITTNERSIVEIIRSKA